MSASYIDTYYKRTLEEDVPRPELSETVEADVCIIGGGLAGLNIALGLIDRGKSVVVLERDRIGFGASGRNGGFCMGGYALGNENAESLVKKVGMGDAKQLFNITKEAQKLIRSRIEKYDIPCEPVDGQVIASWYDDPDELKHDVDYMAENFDQSYEFWEREKVRDLYKTDRYYDAIFLPENFHMHPLRYVHGLARAIEAGGGKIYEDSIATKVDIGEDVKKIQTEKGMVKANHVVYCGSAYFNGINRRLSHACLPISTYVMVTEPLSKEKMETAIRAPYSIHDTRFAYDYYRPMRDGRILWGGRVAYNKTPDDLEQVMKGDMVKVYPQLADVKVEVAWSGLMGYTVHKMPHIGQFQPGVWYCTNFGGNGVGPTTGGGEVIASAIAESDERYQLFEPFGFDYAGGIFGPLVAQGIYHSWEIGDWFNEWRRRKACCGQKKMVV